MHYNYAIWLYKPINIRCANSSFIWQMLDLTVTYYITYIFSRWSVVCWVNFQYRGVLLFWISVGQGPTVLALGAGGGCLDIFLSSIISLFSLPLPGRRLVGWLFWV